MSLSERLVERQQHREAWVSRASELLEADPRIVAAWLWGSEGRGDADALSDVDLFVAVADARTITSVEERFGAYGEVQWSREVPFNAPPGGRYFTVGYTAPLEPLPIDWYWQPFAASVLGTDTRVLFEKTRLPRVATDTFGTFPPMDQRPSPHPEDPAQRLAGLLVWFWSMYGSLAKKLARGQDDEAAADVALLDGVLALALDHLARSHSPISDAPLAALRLLADRMESLHPALDATGVPAPPTARARHALDTAEGLRREGWRP